jgi:hypothetical protein
MNAKSFQVVIRVCKSGDFCLASVTRTGNEAISGRKYAAMEGRTCPHIQDGGIPEGRMGVRHSLCGQMKPLLGYSI